MESTSNYFSYFGNLPEIPLINIFNQTEPNDLITLSRVCTRFSIIFLENEIWKKIALQIGCPLSESEENSFYPQVKNFVIDIKKEIRDLPEALPKDIADVVNSSSAPTFKEIRLLHEYRLARDKVVFWQELGTQIDPSFQIPKYEIFDEMLKVVNGFTDWCKENNNKLTILCLSDKKLISIPAEIQYLTHLTNLVLDKNKISIIPSEIQHLTRLQFLSLINNRISIIPSEIQYLTQLKMLYLDENNISEIPSEIRFLIQLNGLFLDKNQISTIPPEIQYLTQLENLSLDENKISEIPSEIQFLTQLEGLYLDYNQISTIPTEIKHLTQLKKLSLIGNQISIIPSEIQFLTRLEELYLDYDQISTIPAEIKPLILTYFFLNKIMFPK